jgi:uncharacterized protein YutD
LVYLRLGFQSGGAIIYLLVILYLQDYFIKYCNLVFAWFSIVYSMRERLSSRDLAFAQDQRSRLELRPHEVRIVLPDRPCMV